jgi:aerobic carbon-monoxide dehydrogenase small subunit
LSRPKETTNKSPVSIAKSAFKVNNKSYELEFEARTTLWEIISETIGLTGTNRSCNMATCGACTVLVNGIPIYSCHYLAIEAVGKEIFTVEGLRNAASPNGLHPLQEIGYRHHAAECGYCTPGWLVAAKALLDKNPNPTEEEISESLSGHLCRCGAYHAIKMTILDAARVERGEATL